jgi:hypothetical protein
VFRPTQQDQTIDDQINMNSLIEDRQEDLLSYYDVDQVASKEQEHQSNLL